MTCLEKYGDGSTIQDEVLTRTVCMVARTGYTNYTAVYCYTFQLWINNTGWSVDPDCLYIGSTDGKY